MSTTTTAATAAYLYFINVIFLVFLVITSISCCSGRHLLDKESSYTKHSESSTEKDDRKASIDRVSMAAKLVEHSEPYKYAATESEEEAKSRIMHVDVHGYSDNEEKQELSSSSSSSSSSVHQHEGMTASLKLPNKEKIKGEKQPGFNLDYAPPKTHPPSHN